MALDTPRVDLAQGYAAELRAMGLPVYADPAQATANLPALLILPPALAYDRLGGPPSITWRLVALADGPPGLDCWAALDDLLAQAEGALTITSAEPSSYALHGGQDPLPAYLITTAQE